MKIRKRTFGLIVGSVFAVLVFMSKVGKTTKPIIKTVSKSEGISKVIKPIKNIWNGAGDVSTLADILDVTSPSNKEEDNFVKLELYNECAAKLKYYSPDTYTVEKDTCYQKILKDAEKNGNQYLVEFLNSQTIKDINKAVCKLYSILPEIRKRIEEDKEVSFDSIWDIHGFKHILTTGDSKAVMGKQISLILNRMKKRDSKSKHYLEQQSENKKR